MIHKLAWLRQGKQTFKGIREMEINVKKVCCLPKRPDKWMIELVFGDLGNVWGIKKLFDKKKRNFDFYFEDEEADPTQKEKRVITILKGQVKVIAFEERVDTYSLSKEYSIFVTSENLEWNGEDPDAPVRVKFT